MPDIKFASNSNVYSLWFSTFPLVIVMFAVSNSMGSIRLWFKLSARCVSRVEVLSAPNACCPALLYNQDWFGHLPALLLSSDIHSVLNFFAVCYINFYSSRLTYIRMITRMLSCSYGVVLVVCSLIVAEGRGASLLPFVASRVTLPWLDICFAQLMWSCCLRLPLRCFSLQLSPLALSGPGKTVATALTHHCFSFSWLLFPFRINSVRP